jgi:hypothetical protein
MLLSTESSFLWALPEDLVPYDATKAQTSDIPRIILKTELPGIKNLQDNEPITWHHILNVSPTASKKEIDSESRKLSGKFHPDSSYNAPFKEEIFKLVQNAKEQGTASASTRTFRAQVLQKSVYMAEIYTLYRIVKTNWFKNKAKKLRISIQRRTPLLDKSLRFTTLATAKTSSMVWNFLKIGLGLGATGTGIILCGIGIQCGLEQPFADKPYITVNTTDGNSIKMKKFFARFYCVQDSNGNYTFVQVDGNKLVEIGDNLKRLSEEHLDQSVSALAAIGIFSGIPLTVGGIELTLSGIRGIKELFAKKNSANSKATEATAA